MYQTLDTTLTQLGRRWRQLNDIFTSEGVNGIKQRCRRAMMLKLAPPHPILPVLPSDVLAADITCRPAWRRPERRPGRPMSVNWITTPPSPGSGGHTTTFRMINGLKARGYHCRVYYYDVYRGDHSYFSEIARRHFGYDGVIHKIDQGLEDADAVMATSWPTAYAAYTSGCAGMRFYFVQDFEPLFYPAGSVGALAANTYRMGFHAITAGPWLAHKLVEDFDMKADYFEFGCDTQRYRRNQDSRRKGIAFYIRRDTPRRCSELGLMALQLFHERRPEVELHLYGERSVKLPFTCTNHGRVTPEALNDIYNICYAGLSLSATNVSLVPHEMLAAGCIPVVNESEENRMVLDNQFVRYVSLDPHAMASELERIVTSADFDLLSSTAAQSVQARTWDEAVERVDQVLRQALESGSR